MVVMANFHKTQPTKVMDITEWGVSPSDSGWFLKIDADGLVRFPDAYAWDTISIIIYVGY